MSAEVWLFGKYLIYGVLGTSLSASCAVEESEKVVRRTNPFLPGSEDVQQSSGEVLDGLVSEQVAPSPWPSPVEGTPTPSPSGTPVPSPTPSENPSPTPTPTPSPTPTPTPTLSPTPNPTASPAPSSPNNKGACGPVPDPTAVSYTVFSEPEEGDGFPLGQPFKIKARAMYSDGVERPFPYRFWHYFRVASYAAEVPRKAEFNYRSVCFYKRKEPRSSYTVLIGDVQRTFRSVVVDDLDGPDSCSVEPELSEQLTDAEIEIETELPAKVGEFIKLSITGFFADGSRKKISPRGSLKILYFADTESAPTTDIALTDFESDFAMYICPYYLPPLRQGDVGYAENYQAKVRIYLDGSTVKDVFVPFRVHP